jgi:hypothetical protein
MMPDHDTDDEPDELVDRHDGATIERGHIQGTFEYTVELTHEQIDGLRDNLSPEEFAGNIAQSRANAELDPTFNIDRSDVIAQENDYPIGQDMRTFTVYVRFSQND